MVVIAYLQVVTSSNRYACSYLSLICELPQDHAFLGHVIPSYSFERQKMLELSGTLAFGLIFQLPEQYLIWVLFLIILPKTRISKTKCEEIQIKS